MIIGAQSKIGVLLVAQNPFTLFCDILEVFRVSSLCNIFTKSSTFENLRACYLVPQHRSTHDFESDLLGEYFLVMRQH